MIMISLKKACHFITFKDVLMKQVKFLVMVHISSMLMESIMVMMISAR